MTTHTTIGINNNLSTGKTRIAHRAANHKTARWVNKYFYVTCYGNFFFCKDRINNVFNQLRTQRFRINFFRMLRGNNHLFYLGGYPIHITHTYLCFPIGAQIRHSFIFANLC